MTDEIKAFDDVPGKALPEKPEGIGGKDYLENLNAIQIGHGSKVFRGDESGIWLGAKKFADAPYSVSMAGALTATSATITGMGRNFVSTLVWTATDRDTATWASGIVKISDGTSYSIDAGNTGNIAATTYIYLDPAVSTTVLQTTTTAANAAGNNKILLAIVQAGAVGSECIIEVIGGIGTTIDGGKIATDTVTATQINVSTLSAISADIGTITAGSITGVTITGSLFRTAASGARIEIDANLIAGLPAFKLRSGNGAFDELFLYNSGAAGGNQIFEIEGADEIKINQATLSEVALVSIDNNQKIQWKNTGGSFLAFMRLDSNNNTIISHSAAGDLGIESGHKINLTATDGVFINSVQKTAIVPTSKGYRTLYCIESPEVWFMDFCDDKDKIDPLFLEVTEGEMKFIKVEDGGYQVWRRRKGQANFRFEEKTKREYDKNNRFWAGQRQ